MVWTFWGRNQKESRIEIVVVRNTSSLQFSGMHVLKTTLKHFGTWLDLRVHMLCGKQTSAVGGFNRSQIRDLRMWHSSNYQQ